MNKNHDKLMADLGRIIETQNFNSVAEANAFFKELMKNPIPSFPKEALSFRELAEDLIYEAYELPDLKGKEKAEDALTLDPDCIMAYEFLGERENTPQVALVFYEKCITLGRKLYCGPKLKENKGLFWGKHETRSFMRAMAQAAECLRVIEKVSESVELMEELLKLNPNDNQGIRYLLLLYLIDLNENEKFIKYDTQFSDESTAFLQYNRALFAFKISGESAESGQILKKALLSNKYVPGILNAKKEIFDVPSTYSLGSKQEAEYIAFYSKEIWQKKPGALEWMKKHTGKK